MLGFVLYLLNTFVADIFASIISLFGYEKISSPSTVTLDHAFLLKELILTCILPGVCEEFLHRGIMLFAGKKVRKP
jgi:membrane protease YdiL (CAAX protease family)